MADTDYKQPNKNRKPGYIYVLDYGDGKTFKIGHTQDDPKNRLKSIATGLPVIMPKVDLVMSVWVKSNCYLIEQLLHMEYDEGHVKGEWFELNFIDLVEIHALLQRFSFVELHDRWFKIVPEDAAAAAQEGRLDWLHSLPHFAIEEYKTADDIWQKVIS